MEHFLRSSHFSGGNAAYIEDLYDTYLHDRNGVPEQWSSFFDTLPRTNGSTAPDNTALVCQAAQAAAALGRPLASGDDIRRRFGGR